MNLRNRLFSDLLNRNYHLSISDFSGYVITSVSIWNDGKATSNLEYFR